MDQENNKKIQHWKFFQTRKNLSPKKNVEPEILSYNKFASLYLDEDEACNGSLENAATNVDQRWKRSRAKKCVKKKKKLPAMKIKNIKSGFYSKGSPEAFRCHICNKSQSKLKAINNKKKKSDAEKEMV